MARRCLYYPFIHFRDEGWLKLSTLYWDDVTRIVPRAYAPRDGRDVRALEDAGVLKRVDPAKYEEPVSDLFRVLLARHAAKLARRYDVRQRQLQIQQLLDQLRVELRAVDERQALRLT